MTKTVGQTWFMISWSTNSASLAWLMLNPATSWSSAYVIVPRLLTADALELELGVLLLLPLLLHAASAVMPASARARPPKIRLFFIVSPPSARCWRRRPETGSSCVALLVSAVMSQQAVMADGTGHGTGGVRIQPVFRGIRARLCGTHGCLPALCV